MDYLPMVYRFNPLTFKPRNGYGVIYSYNVLNKIYIGQTKNSMRARHRAHIYQDSKNCVVDEYLSSNVYILKIITLAPEDDLNNLEMYFIEQYNTIWPYGWNFTSGGRNYKREETSRLINSYKHTGSKN